MGKITNIERIRRKLLGKVNRLGSKEMGECIFLGRREYISTVKRQLVKELDKKSLTRAYLRAWRPKYRFVFYGAGAACMADYSKKYHTLLLWDKSFTVAGFMWQCRDFYISRDLTDNELREAAALSIRMRQIPPIIRKKVFSDWIKSIGAECEADLLAA